LNINFHQSTPLEGEIVIALAEEDYMPAVAESIRTYRSKTEVKGFRKGQVPANIIQKMYGPEIVFRTTFDLAIKNLNSYLQDHSLNLLQDPIMVDNTLYAADQVNVTHPGTIEIKFAYGLKPEVDLSSLPQVEVDQFEIKGVSDNAIMDVIKRLQTQYGTTQEVTQAEPGDKLAEPDQDFFVKLFPNKEVTTLDELKDKIRHTLTQHAQMEADNLLMNKIKQAVLTHLSFDLPTDVIKQGLKSQFPNWNEETIEAYYRLYTQNNLRWSLIAEKVIQAYDIHISTTEIAQYLQLTSPSNNMDLEALSKKIEQSFATGHPDKSYQDAHHWAIESKVLNTLKAQIKIHAQAKTVEEFNTLVADMTRPHSHDHDHGHDHHHDHDHHCSEC
jgi:FKBP-type peptidyl-prolyl cis-trans isomerase (trigger factor)